MTVTRSFDAALDHLRAGLCVAPARMPEKIPELAGWKELQFQLPTEEDLRVWFAADRPMCIITGASSGNLEVLDFDCGGEGFAPWQQLVEQSFPGLVASLPIEQSPSGGFHVVYRLDHEVPGSKTLARKEIETAGPEPVVMYGKTYQPIRRGDRYFIQPNLIETRGRGGLFVCHPTPGYVLKQGSFHQIPVLTAEQREVLIESALALNEVIPTPRPVTLPSEPCGRPGDDFAERGDIAALLQKHGWTLVRGGENEHWRRPGKVLGTSATLKNRVFYVFSTSAPPFEGNTAYGPFAVYALLEHGGDFSRAASTLRAGGYGSEVNQENPVVLDGFLSKLKSPGPGTIVHNPPNVKQLVQRHPDLRAPVIHKLLRQGETMNLIAPSKAGKSWLASDLAIALVTGEPWLGVFPTTPGKVLIVDNELHPETSANRIPRVAEARGFEAADYDSRLFVDNLRGRLKDIHAMGSYFLAIDPGRYRLIVLDAFYRFLPRDTDENDNGAMANIYNLLDSFADHLGCSFVLIHHASKGNQAGKSVTDVGSGAGSQSRATDTHVILRPHEEPGCVVLEAAVRSWPPVDPLGLRWHFPIWTPDSSLDPGALKSEYPRRRPKEKPKPDEPVKKHWDSETFASSFVTETPQSEAALIDAALEAGLSEHKATKLLRRAVERGFVHRWARDGERGIGYASLLPPQSPEAEEPHQVSKPSKRQTVLNFLAANPDLSNREVAKRCEVSHTFVRKLRGNEGDQVAS